MKITIINLYIINEDILFIAVSDDFIVFQKYAVHGGSWPVCVMPFPRSLPLMHKEGLGLIIIILGA